MLDTLYSGCAAVAGGVQMVTDFVRCIIHLNYEFVTSVLHVITQIVTTALFVFSQVKLFIVTISTYILDFILEVYSLFISILTLLGNFFTGIFRFAHLCYATIATACLVVVQYISNGALTIKHLVYDSYTFLMTMANYSYSLVISSVTSIFSIITALGTYCVNFVTGVWLGLGFVLSSVASFPLYCVQCIQNAWMKCVESAANVLTTTTKETYLGIVVLCLVYLTLSNTFRYIYCRGLSSLFPRRLRGRRTRGNNFYWHFDRGFESDFEDMYGSDTEDRLWMNNRDADNDPTDDEDDSDDDDDTGDNDNDSDSNNSDDISDNDNDSDEYTVVTEESDSDASINSQTFSTESSDHEIEVQLPTVDERYSLRSRSSTPSRVPKLMSSPEEFDREMERERDKRKCVVCQDQIKSVLVLPCRHMCMCVMCADQIVRSRIMGRRVCPLCRTKISKVMNIYV